MIIGTIKESHKLWHLAQALKLRTRSMAAPGLHINQLPDELLLRILVEALREADTAHWVERCVPPSPPPPRPPPAGV